MSHLNSDGMGYKTQEEPEKGSLFKIWSVAKDFTAKMAFEKIIKGPFNALFKRRFKTRKNGGDHKQERWWIEVKGSEEELGVLKSKQREIESSLACRLEAKAF